MSKRFGLTDVGAGAFARGFGNTRRLAARFGGGLITGAVTGVVFSDNFNRADGAVGNGWLALGASGGTIATNQITFPNTPSTPDGILRPDLLTNGQITVTLVNIQSVSSAQGVVLRWVDANNFVYLYMGFNTGSVDVYKMVAGTPTLMGQGSFTPAAGDILTVRATGTLINTKISRAGSTVLNFNATMDIPTVAGKCGLRAWPNAAANTPVMDDFSLSGS